MTIEAAADGSALGNPGPAGWAWYVDEANWQAGGWPMGTNNQGELMAVLALLRATAHLDDDLVVHCDSQYVINSVTRWMPNWKRKGWRKSDGKPVLNRDLLSDLDEALTGRSVRFEWVRGHTGHPLNEAADSRARAAATAYQRGTSVPSGPGWGSATAATGPTAPATPDASAHPQDFNADTLFEMDADDDAAALVQHQRALHSPSVRSDPERLESLLHADFTMITASGAQLGRAEFAHAAAKQYGAEQEPDEIRVDLIGDDVAIVSYREAAENDAVHTAIWLRSPGGSWQIRQDQASA